MIKTMKEWIPTLTMIAVIAVIVLLFNTFVGQRTIVLGSSMESNFSDGDNVIVSKLSYRNSQPERFDVIVFPAPDSGRPFIKRVIGLPGETVQIKEDGAIFINGEKLDEDFGNETIASDNIGRVATQITLGDDECFVLGDNRNNSNDSRFEAVGNVNIGDITGKVCFKIWPLEEFGTIN